jgi:hypothetical protein
VTTDPGRAPDSNRFRSVTTRLEISIMPSPATLQPPEACAASQCPHTPPCPAKDAPDAQAAHVVAAHYDQGWSLLCNGLVLFDDGDKLPALPPTTTSTRTETEGHAS